jgi:predicted transcriptional regulator
MAMTSIAHDKLRRMRDRNAFSVNDLARRAGCHRGAIRDALAGSEPKVTLALALERELGIPVADWTVEGATT